jgi:muramoyltetrapeptide carboxypeptidase
MIKPPFLHEGDLVRLISPAGMIAPELVENAETCLKSWGLHVRRGNHVTGQTGRFSGSEEERLNDLQEALDDHDCRAVLCSRGGYGTIHLLEKVDLTAFEKSPKWLIGYSDITMLHGLLQKQGYSSIHGGMAKALAGEIAPQEGYLPESARWLKNMLFGQLPPYCTKAHSLNRFGSATGPLVGGNLSILYSLRGTPYDYIPAGSVLFIEDIGERPYMIDRIMYNLKLGGILEKLGGLIVGQFSDYEEDPLFGKTVAEIVADAVSKYNYPVCFDFPVGHVERNLPLMCGAKVRMEVLPEGSTLNYVS